MSFLNRQTVQAVKAQPPEPLEIPEWGGSVGVRTLGAAAQVRLTRLINEAESRAQNGSLLPEDTLQFIVELLSATLVGDDGKPLFSVANEDDRAFLESQPLELLNEIRISVSRICGLEDDAEIKKKKESSPAADNGE